MTRQSVVRSLTFWYVPLPTGMTDRKGPRMTAVSLTTYRRRVDDLLLGGVDFRTLEATIDGLPLGDQAKAALWLYANIQRDRGVDRGLERELDAAMF